MPKWPILTLSGSTPYLPGKSIKGSKRTFAADFSALTSRRVGDQNAGAL